MVSIFVSTSEFHFEVLDLSYLHEFISINKVGCQSTDVQQISLVSHECFLDNGILGDTGIPTRITPKSKLFELDIK